MSVPVLPFNENLDNDDVSLRHMSQGEQLPENFAQRMINLEMHCEKSDSSPDHINQLMDLYTVS